MLFYSLLRVIFWQVNHAQFHDLPTSELVWAFIRGIRFDLAAIALTNALFFMVYLLPLQDSWKNRQLRMTAVAFSLINDCFISLNIVDIEYYHFTGKR